MPFSNITSCKPVTFAAILLLWTSLSFAQGFSPYSAIGIGNFRDLSISGNQGYGNLSAGFGSTFQINSENPASHSHQLFFSFEAGGNFEGSVINDADTTYQGGDGSLSHLAFSLPIKPNKLGLAFGLQTLSSINYRSQVLETLPNLGTVATQLQQGDGNYYKSFVGLGYKIGNFSVGANGAFLFGNANRINLLFFGNDFDGYPVQTTQKVSLNGFGYDLGVQYRVKLNEKSLKADKANYHLTLGAFGHGNYGIELNTNTYTQRFNPSGFLVDTIGTPGTQAYSGQLPMKLGLGFMLEKSANSKRPVDWKAGLDFVYNKSSDMDLGISGEQYEDNWLIRTGFEIVPNRSAGKDDQLAFLQRINYRVGLYTGTSHIRVTNEQLNQYGITFGFGIPTSRAMTNVSLDIRSRGASSAEILGETFYNLKIGFTFADFRFIKRKFD